MAGRIEERVALGVAPERDRPCRRPRCLDPAVSSWPAEQLASRTEEAHNRAMPRRHRSIDLKRTLQHVRVPSAISDSEGVITWLNDAAKRMFGDLRGRSFFSIVSPEDVPLARRQLERKLSGAALTDYAVDVFTRDGRRRRAEISSVPIEGGDRCHAIFGVVLTESPRPAPRPHPMLTPRQNEVLHLLDDGLSTDQIAAELHLSKETVRNHIRHVLRALGAHSRLEAVALARGQGLLGEA
jgi:PAS domain S-box-containing protein